MKLRLLLITGLMAFIGQFAQAQCTAYGYYSQNGATAIFYDSSYSANGHFNEWWFGDGTSHGYGTQVPHTYAANGTYTACLFIYDSVANCNDTTCFTITVSSYSNCNASLTYSVDSTNSLLYYFAGSNPPTGGHAEIVVWDYATSDTTYVSQYASHLFDTTGTHVAYYILFDSLNQMCDSVEVIINVGGTTGGGCNASMSYSVDSTNSSTYYFYGSAPPTGGSSTWYIYSATNSTTYSTQNCTHTFNSGGSYTIVYAVFDNSRNLCDSASTFITLSGGTGCNASFNYNVDSSNPYKLNFNNTSTGAVSAYWWFGGNNTSTTYNPTFTFANSGYHTVCLTTYDSVNNLCDSICQTVYVPGSNSGNCSAWFYYYNQTGQGTTNFYDSTSRGDIFEWNFGDGSYGYSSNPVHTYTNSGTYNACLYVYDINNATGDTSLCDSFCQTVNIYLGSSCNASFTYSVNQRTVSFSNNSTGSYGFVWEFGDGDTSNAANPTHTYTPTGTNTFNVCLSTYDSLGYICDTFCTTITLNSSCNPTMSYTIDSTNSNRYYFTGSNPPSGWFAEWDIYEGSSSNSYSGQTATHTFSGTGYISVYYTVYNADSSFCGQVGDTFNLTGASCSASYYLGVDTNNLYNLYIINTSTGTTSNTNYLWNFGDGSTSTSQYPTHQYANFGLYNLCLTISDSATGCNSMYCDSIGLDSNGNLLKRDGFSLTIVDEKDFLDVPSIDVIQDLKLYPNPSTGLFTLELNVNSTEQLTMQALNVMGQVVLTNEYTALTGSNEFKIDMTGQPDGMYFISLKSGNQVKNLRVYLHR